MSSAHRSPVGSFARPIFAAFVSAAFLWTLLVAASPALHARIHPDATRSEHTCAVTLVASGSYDHVADVPQIGVPVAANQFVAIPALTPRWVASPFLGASVFEHAPPARP
jgi:hypothetical protein